MRKAGRFSVYFLLAIGIGLFAVLVLLSTVLQVGERLARVGPWLEYGFYGLCVVLLYMLLLRPLLQIFRKPAFDIHRFMDSWETYPYSKCADVARELLKSGSLNPEDAQTLSSAFHRGTDIRGTLRAIFTDSIPTGLDEIISTNAQRVMLSTAIAPNGRIDSMFLLVLNIQMIHAMTERCGFKPSLPQLVKTFVNILATALLYVGIEDIELEELFPELGASLLGAVPGLAYVASALVQGVSSALFTLRIGYIARDYLLHGYQNREGARSSATKLAFQALPKVIANTVRSLPKTWQVVSEKMFRFG